MKKLLFITHEATRTGAPMLLLNLIQWLTTYRKDVYDITVLCVEGGELVKEFEKLTPTILYNKKHSYRSKRINTFFNKRYREKQKRKLQNQPWDVIFSNTIVNGKELEYLKKTEIPVITYVHELQFSIELFLKRGKVQGSLNHTDYFLCGSKLVQHTLVDKYQVSEAQTKVVNSFVPFKSSQKDKLVSMSLRKELDIPSDALVVGMMGSFIWRKGPDFFIETAKQLQKENIYFIWVGANNLKYMAELQYDLDQLNATPKLKLIPPSKEYKAYFNTIDVFYLSSREDPYPMVMVEASSYGIPILCFENSGGTQEFIDDKTGHIIPYGNTTIAAEKIRHYNNNRIVLTDNADYIREKSQQTHDVASNAAIIDEVINNQLHN